MKNKQTYEVDYNFATNIFDNCFPKGAKLNNQNWDIITIITSNISTKSKLYIIKEKYPDFYSNMMLKELCKENKNEKTD